MILLVGFAFLAGIITILSPCILPILPIVLSGSLSTGKRKPLGIVTGFVLSFTFFTLFLSTIVQVANVSADSLRFISIVIIFLFGLSLLLPQFQVLTEKLFSKLSNRFAPQNTIGPDGQPVKHGFWGGILIGISLGLIWTPCVGPIIASVITLAATNNVNFAAFFITFAYAMGTAIPMLAIMLGGRSLLNKIPWLLPNTGKIQKIFGVVMILTAIAIYFNVDRNFQTFILDRFPSYGTGLTQIEQNDAVLEELEKLNQNTSGADFQKREDEVFNVTNSPAAPDFVGITNWLNSDPLTLKDLKGKVVLIDFWTYSCINCIRTFPYLTRWYDKYKDDGFVIVGVHTPEFEFEKDTSNVEEALKRYGITYPVAQDNDFATWNAYNNRYWPAHYLIDKDGIVRRVHFGEGEYEETEKAIQLLLKETGRDISTEMVELEEQTPRGNQSPETYLGSKRMEYFQPDGKLPNGAKEFTLEKNLGVSRFSLGGTWTIQDEYAASGRDAVLEYRFVGDKVFLVMAPPKGDVGKARVFLDGKPVTQEDAGKDITINTESFVRIDSDRLYELVDLESGSGEHILRLEFTTPGVEVFAFTFGS